MAVLPSIPGLIVTVHPVPKHGESDGNQYEEYEPDESTMEPSMKRLKTQSTQSSGAENTVASYIAAKPGTSYRVCLQIKDNFQHMEHDLVFEIHIDGKLMEYTVIHKKLFQKGGREGYTTFVNGATYHENNTRGKREMQTVLHPFQFGLLSIEDDPQNVTSDRVIERTKNLGEITFRVWRCTIKGAQKPSAQVLQKLLPLRTVPEKVMKGRAISLESSFGPGEPIRNRQYFDLDKIDEYDRPMAIFNFCYRTVGDLEKLHIIPKAPKTVKRPEDYTPSELMELARLDYARRLRESSTPEPVDQKIKVEHENRTSQTPSSTRKRPRSEPEVNILEDSDN